MVTLRFQMMAAMFISFTGVSTMISAKYEWVHPKNKDVRTIYYQGVHASQAQVSKYTGLRGFIATTGEHVVCKRGFDVIENPFIGKELDEVQLKRVYDGKRAKIRAFFRHPVQMLGQCFNNLFENKLFGIAIKSTCRSQKTTLKAHNVRIDAMSLAQTNDISEHQARYDLCMEQYPDSEFILYGVSRGAATTFNACALNQYDTKKIQLIILEGCFDSVAGAVQNSPLFLQWNSLKRAFVKMVASATQFKAHGLAPIKLVDDFPEQVPVIFVTSVCDRIVPMASVQRLVDALKMRGKNPIYMLTLQHSSHPKYMMDNKEDTENYRDFLHALYKSLNLPYIAEYAISGEYKGLLDACFVQ